jgi:hypothetical protein
MADRATIASFATAGGTLVMAVATSSATRSSNRSTRVAEDGFLTGSGRCWSRRTATIRSRRSSGTISTMPGAPMTKSP